jgi:Flp pilus assembly pilin Flp
VLEHILSCFIRVFHSEVLDEDGQSTAEYALVIVAAAAIVGLLLSWITKSNGIGSIFNGVIGRVLKWIH